MGQSLNARMLETALGVPVVPVDGRTGWGVSELMSALETALANSNRRSALAELPEEAVSAYRSIRELLA